MGTNLNDRWDRIQKGVKETEKLIGQRDYNMSMIKARQTLEFMVSQLISLSGFGIDAADLHAQIDVLYQNQVISKNTAEHFHQIRIIGNKAIHEGDTNAYNANQAYHMLSQEVYTFAHDYRNVQRGGRSSQTARTTPGSSRQVSGSRSAQGSTRQAVGSRQAQSSSRQSSGSRRPSSGASSRRRQPQRRSGFTIYDLLKILVPILCIILLFCVVRLVKPAKDDKATTAAPTTTETSAEATTAAEPETEESTAAVVYKTTSILNVRPQPNTTDDRIGQLDAGVTVEYVRAHDEKWAVIMYNGQEAYVASEYLTTE